METRVCQTCRWLDYWFGVCCNGESEWGADVPPENYGCEHWEEVQDEQSDMGS